MLEKQITDFLDYCKVAGFSGKSIQSLTTSLREFNSFLEPLAITSPGDVSYRHLSDFVADFQTPSIHKKKARIWGLRQFFHFLTLFDLSKENIVLGLPYPRIEKTVPHFLTVEEYNRILGHFLQRAHSTLGLRNLIIILILGLLGLRTNTIVSLNIEHIDIIAGLAWIKEKGRRRRLIVLPTILAKVLKTRPSKFGNFPCPIFGPFKVIREHRILNKSTMY